MKLSQTIIGLSGCGVALFIPLNATSQTVAAAMPSTPTQVFNALPATSIDAAKQLEGRLFFSAKQRAQMDDLRKRGLVSSDHGQLIEPPPSVLNGFVKRSDGSITIWLDGQARSDVQSTKVHELQPFDVGADSGAIMVLDSRPIENGSVQRLGLKKAKKKALHKATAKHAGKK